MALSSPTQAQDYPRPTITDSPQPEAKRALYMAIELSSQNWKIAFSDGGRKDIVKTLERKADSKVMRRELSGLLAGMRRRFSLPEDAPVRSCMEAGRDGFWPHRFLQPLGIHNVVVDPASMRTNRRARRAKTDRIDARQMLADLVRFHAGDDLVWAVLRIPTVEQEDARRLHRELERVKSERTKHRQRIMSILATVGSVASVGDVLKDLKNVRQWDGSWLPAGVRNQLVSAAERFKFTDGQVKSMERVQREALKKVDTPELRAVERLTMLRGIGEGSAWMLVFEFFAWRKFQNRRQVAGAVGLGGTPHNTGMSAREQGISKAGNPMIRTRMIELAWLWLRYQPRHKISRWFRERFADAGGRRKRAGIVGVARRLLIELWHLAEHGVVPEGALLTVE